MEKSWIMLMIFCGNPAYRSTYKCTLNTINYLPPWYFFMFFFVLAELFQNQLFLKNYFRNTIRVSNSLDPDKGRHSVRPDLVPNSLQKLSAYDTRRLPSMIFYVLVNLMVSYHYLYGFFHVCE